MLPQDVKRLEETQEKINDLIHAFEYIMSLSSNDKGYTKLIEMDIETDNNLPAIASEPYTLPLKQQEWAKKS